MQVGLHIRITESLHDVIEKALRLELLFFQCFFSIKKRMALLQPTKQEIAHFVAMRRQHFTNLYAHGSYWINLASSEQVCHYALDRELQLARALEFTHFVIHPGAIKPTEKKEVGIDAVARSINKAVKKHTDILFLLENTAHGNMTIGGDIDDLKQIYEKIDQPDRVGFCIDTAHAHVYGYDIVTAAGRADFIAHLDALLGFDHIKLIHVNDTYDACASRLDRHQLLGQGTLGISVIQALVTDARLRHIPILTEPPVISEAVEREQLAIMRSWYI